MVTINEIFRTYFNEFKKSHNVSDHVDRVIQSMINCRTEKMGQRILECEDCGYEEITYCSCRNRHCPLCQMYTKEKWVQQRKKEIINTKYYHFVFTLPKELEIITKMNEELIYNLIFKCVKETLIELASDKKYLGAKTGAIIILHTWAQNLSYHPHVHLLVPAGGLDEVGKWLEVKADYFIPAKVLSTKFKKKFMFLFGQEVKHNKLLSLPKKAGVFA